MKPIKEMGKIVEDDGGMIVVEGGERRGEMEIDVEDVDCDFLGLCGDKMCGGSGMGVV